MEYKRLTNKQISHLDGNAYPKEYYNWYNRLKELEDKIENGTLIEIPCKVEEKIYYINKKELQSIKIVGFEICNNKEYESIVNLEHFGLVYLDDYNKTWFTTKEQAEARLKELKGE